MLDPTILPRTSESWRSEQEAEQWRNLLIRGNELRKEWVSDEGPLVHSILDKDEL
jgi:hypothetical protein